MTPSTPKKTPTPTTKEMAAVSDKDYADVVVAPHEGKVVVVNFWASYCLPCLKEIPNLQALATEHAKDVDVVFVSTDPPSGAAHALAQLARRKIELASFVVENDDPEPFIALINAQGKASGKESSWGGEMPYTVVYSRDGSVFQKMPGAHSKEEFNAAIAAAVAQKK